MVKRIFCLYLLFVAIMPVIAQQGEVSMRWYGFINHEMMRDSRAVVAAREGTVILFPQPIRKDHLGNDLNDRSSFNFMVLSSRLGVVVEGYSAFGANASVQIETDFLGTAAGLHHMARLRHAFVKMDWGRSSLLAGQYWHPMFVPSVFPSTISFAGGVPFHTLNRSPQLQFNYLFEGVRLSAYLLGQSDFASLGPIGSSAQYLRNSGLPEAALQFSLSGQYGEFGGTAAYQVLKPGLSSIEYVSDSPMKSFSASAFGRLDHDLLTWKFQSSYSKNPSHLVMLGGYGEAGVSEGGAMQYAGLPSWSSWTDLETSHQRLHFGLMIGYAKTLGSSRDITGDVWARGADIASLYRVGPRVALVSGNTLFGVEVLADWAAYGNPDIKYQVKDTQMVHNTRLAFLVKHTF